MGYLPLDDLGATIFFQHHFTLFITSNPLSHTRFRDEELLKSPQRSTSGSGACEDLRRADPRSCRRAF